MSGDQDNCVITNSNAGATGKFNYVNPNAEFSNGMNTLNLKKGISQEEEKVEEDLPPVITKEPL